MTISIVIPVYNEEENVKNVYCEAKTVLTSLNLPHEIVFIDDGSRDRTYRILKSIHDEDKHVKIIQLDKNYGQAYALLAGFEFAKGEIIITMDADLQNSPYDIPYFLRSIEKGYNLVSGWRYERNDSLTRKLISTLANYLIRIRTKIQLHDYGCAFMAARKELIDKLKSYGRDARFIKPLLVCLSNSITEIKVRHNSRKMGKSKYDLIRILKTGLDFLFNFTIELKEKKNNALYHIAEIIGD
jgi:glycosyltransferase involved in cell wall biosynthesis